MDKKKLVAALGIILLSTVGSGIWDLVRPMLGWALSAVIVLSNLGLSSLRDAMYADVAITGASNPVGITAAMGLLASLITVTCAAILLPISILLHTSAIEVQQRLGKRCLVLSVALLCVTMPLIVGSLRAEYVIQLTVFYERFEAIAGPYLTDKEIKQYRASLAQVQSRDDYVQIVKSMSSRIEAAGKKPPTKDLF